MRPTSVPVLAFLSSASSRTRDEICRALSISSAELQHALGDLWVREVPGLARPTTPTKNLRGYVDPIGRAPRWKITAAGKRLVKAWREALRCDGVA